jgi:hypothetical protein
MTVTTPALSNIDQFAASIYPLPRHGVREAIFAIVDSPANGKNAPLQLRHSCNRLRSKTDVRAIDAVFGSN